MTKDFFTLVELLELTRHQPQSGYALAGIPKGEQSDLAQHHYLVAMIAWQLAERAIRKGGSVNLERLVKLALIHDLGELFGGDIAAPYARANPAARRAAKAFEAENQLFLVHLFGGSEETVRTLFDEERTAASDEAQLVKMADFIECTHYKRLLGRLRPGDITLARNVCDKRLSLIQDVQTRKTLRELIDRWLAACYRPATEFFESEKSINRE